MELETFLVVIGIFVTGILAAKAQAYVDKRDDDVTK